MKVTTIQGIDFSSLHSNCIAWKLTLVKAPLCWEFRFPYTSRRVWVQFVVSALILGPVVQKPINANPRLKINQEVYYSTPKCFSTLIFGKTLHENKLILKNRNKEKKLSPKSWKHKTKVYTNPGLS